MFAMHPLTSMCAPLPRLCMVVLSLLQFRFLLWTLVLIIFGLVTLFRKIYFHCSFSVLSLPLLFWMLFGTAHCFFFFLWLCVLFQNSEMFFKQDDPVLLCSCSSSLPLLLSKEFVLYFWFSLFIKKTSDSEWETSQNKNKLKIHSSVWIAWFS